jgi:ribokinase
MTGRVVVVGSLYLLVRAEVERIPRAGDSATALRTRREVAGRGVAQAMAVQRAGAPVLLVAAVGDDDAGRWCAGRLEQDGIVTRLQVVGTEETGNLLVMTEDGRTENGEEGTEESATLLVPGANTALDGGAALTGVEPDDVVLVQLDVPSLVVAELLREADRRQIRVVVNASPLTTVDPEVAAIADPFVVGERDAALLADVGLIPSSLCVTFGRAGAMWDGLRIERDDLGTPAMAPSGTEVFCGALAAGLAAGADRASALRAAVTATGEPLVPGFVGRSR